jgi:hypothetical protein
MLLLTLRAIAQALKLRDRGENHFLSSFPLNLLAKLVLLKYTIQMDLLYKEAAHSQISAVGQVSAKIKSSFEREPGDTAVDYRCGCSKYIALLDSGE